jgi:putative ABC transport system permease protein
VEPARLAHGFTGDLKLAARRLLATPLFTIFAVLSLAVGVAVTTAAYSVVESIFLADLGIREPERVAFVVTPYDGRLMTGSISEPDFRDVRAAQTSFSRVSAFASVTPALALPSGTEVITAEAVDGAYFATLGITASIGRVIQTTDEIEGARVAVLSDGLWRARFAADPRIVGQAIRISGQAFEVIGVADAAFKGAMGWIGGTRFWIPLASEALLTPPSAAPPRDRRRLAVFGRLAPSATVTSATAELGTIAARLDAAFPPRVLARGVGPTERPWRVKSLAAITEDDNSLHRFGLTLVALVALVLVVACTNLANLVLARGTTRQRDLAVRCALGASRWRLVREQCTESLLLAAAGAVASYAVFQILRVLMDADFSLTLPTGGRLTLAVRPVLNVPAFGMAAACLLLALGVFGLEPALQLTRAIDVRGALAASTGVGSPRVRRQQALLRWQVAISAGFFIIATMFVKYTIQEARHDPGVDLDRLGVTVLNFQKQPWDEARVRRTLDRVIEEGRNDPSVEAMSVSTGMPFGVPAMRFALSVPERGDDRFPATGIAATPSIFRTLGVPIVRGRAFDDRDHAAAAPVVVISAFTARRLFGTIDAVGRQLVLQGRPRTPAATVIGVARDTDVRQVLFDPRPLVYLPLAQQYDPALAVAVRSTESATRAVRSLREALRRADPDLPAEVTDTARVVLTGPFVFIRSAGLAAIELGALTLLLAMVGLYGIQSHLVAHRTREIGVRMSFGASAAQIKRMVLRDGYRPVLDGLLFGLSIGLVGRAIVRTYLELDVTIVDPWMLLVAPIPLLLAAFFACYLPARRASGVDPNVALRCE